MLLLLDCLSLFLFLLLAGIVIFVILLHRSSALPNRLIAMVLTHSYTTLTIKLQLGHVAISSPSLNWDLLISNRSPHGHG